jgi:hypothetical protein
MTLAAIELGDSELVEKQLGFILQYHNKTTGGLATFPATRKKITEDPGSTAFLGWAACGLKNRELADSILPFFEKLANQKIENNKFWLRIAPNGSLIKTIPENAEAKEYVIQVVLNGQHPNGYWLKNGKPWVTVSAEQCFWLTDIAKRL